MADANAADASDTAAFTQANCGASDLDIVALVAKLHAESGAIDGTPLFEKGVQCFGIDGAMDRLEILWFTRLDGHDGLDDCFDGCFVYTDRSAMCPVTLRFNLHYMFI